MRDRFDAQLRTVPNSTIDHSFEQLLLLLVGVMQGVALVTFPAISTVLTSANGYGLSSSSYGLIFLPQVIAAIAASFLGGKLSRLWGAKHLLLLGLMANTASMGVLLLSYLWIHEPTVALPMLLTATALMGFGFGAVVPLLNTFIADFQPQKVDQSILMLNALLGLGTALAPALAALVVGPGIWWLLPLLVLVAAALLLLACRAQPLQLSSNDQDRGAKAGLQPGSPGLLVLFVLVAILYGLIETLNGNWSVLLMSRRVESPPQIASMALTVFWAMVTIGRLFFSGVSRWLTPKLLLPGLPVFLAVVLVAISRLTSGDESSALVLFALAGFGCSAMLPLIISVGQKRLNWLGESVAGLLIASYQLGFGLAAFGGGSLQQALQLPISTLFGWGAWVALALALLSVCIIVPKGLASLSQR